MHTLVDPILALVHNVELNKAGWRNKTIDRLVLAALWLRVEALSAIQIHDLISTELGFQADHSEISRALDRIKSEGSVDPQSQGRFLLTELKRIGLDAEISQVEREENAAASKWQQCVEEAMAGDYVPWKTFKDQLLEPVVTTLGAGTYELLLGKPARDDLRVFDSFATAMAPLDRGKLRLAIDRFFGAREENVRSYVLRCLRADLSLKAGQLPQQIIRTLLARATDMPHFVLLIDTNFLFSLLDLHQNPSNEAAQALRNVLGNLPEDVQVQLYVLPITCDEVKRVLIASKHACAGINIEPNLARATLSSGFTSGVIQRYIQRCLEAGHSISPDDYFNPYLESLNHILRANQISVLDLNTEELRTKQAVIDDIEEFRAGLEKRKRPRTYDRIEHDVILRHVAVDHRRSAIESPSEAKYWVITVDYTFIGFDAFKADEHGSIPVCVHPAHLVQMLSFWTPRTPEYEDALVECMRLPFLFQEFDREAESVTMAILRALSRFEDVRDLPESAVIDILINQGLRARLADNLPGDEEFELVREALVTTHAEVRAQLDELELREAAALAKAEKSRLEASEMKARLNEAQEEISRISSEKDEQVRLKEQLLVATERRRFAWVRLVGVPIFGGLIAGAVGWWRAAALNASPKVIAAVSLLLVLSFLGFISCRWPSPGPRVLSWRLLKTYRRFSSIVFVGAVCALLVEVLGNRLAEVFWNWVDNDG